MLTSWLEKSVRIIATAQQIDFNGNVGQMIVGILFAVAAMERENLRENTKRGIAAAKARGVKLSKRPKLFAKDIIPLLEQRLPLTQVAAKLNKSTQVVYDCLKREGISLQKLRKRLSA